MTTRILLTGSSGFHGNAILSQLRVSNCAQIGRLVRAEPAGEPAPGERVTVGSLGDRDAVRRALQGVGSVIHSASYVGYDPALCREVNIDGTARLVDEAQRAGVRDFVYLSTAAVFGSPPHRGTGPTDVTAEPTSVLSQSRLAAERIVLAAGGRVVRPALVVGAGDRWVVPSVVRITRELSARINDGAALVSMIHVRELARLVVALVGRPQLPAVLTAANPRPVAVSALLDLLAEWLPAAVQSMTLDQALALAAERALSASQVQTLGVDNWFEAQSTWDAAGLAAPEALTLDAADLAFYRETLG